MPACLQPAPRQPIPPGRRLRHALALALFVGALAIGSVGIRAQETPGDFQESTHLTPYDEPPIRYSKSRPGGPVAALLKRLDHGEVELEYDEHYGYLLSLLDALKIPRSSQVLVFSKTSFHRTLISPQNPRAIFFNDDVYVGWVRGGAVIEIASADPQNGGMFHTLPQAQVSAPRPTRDNACLECHVSAKTLGVPGHLVRSFFTDEKGWPEEVTGTPRVSHNLPLTDRWGGWYVTGTTGNQLHRANVFGKTAIEQRLREPAFQSNLTNLTAFFDAPSWPEPGSDAVALMVLEHQVHLHNLLTRLNYEARIALAEYGHVRHQRFIIESFLRYLLFVDEPPLASPVQGTSDFAQWFERQGPRDAQGRSLRQLDLQTRLLKHPCSHLIYSAAFDQLPAPLKADIYRRLWDILTGKNTEAPFDQLTGETRATLREILLATKPGLPDYWKPAD
jgi:hypothetical protein